MPKLFEVIEGNELDTNMYKHILRNMSENISTNTEEIYALQESISSIDEDIASKIEKLKGLKQEIKEETKRLRKEIKRAKKNGRKVAIDLRDTQRSVKVDASFLNKLNKAIQKDGSKHITYVDVEKRYVKTEKRR